MCIYGVIYCKYFNVLCNVIYLDCGFVGINVIVNGFLVYAMGYEFCFLI